MPSYRRDRPESSRPSGPRPPRFRREEPEEEEPRFRRPSSFRREAPAPSEYASRPVSPADREELWEALVPKSEREDPDFEYHKVFEILRQGPGARITPPPMGPSRETPRQESPYRGGSTRPERGPGGPPVVNAGDFFDLNRIWSAVATLRQDPRFKRGSPVAVVRLAPEREMQRFLQVDSADVNVILEEIAYSINTQKPRDFPGRFQFQRGQDGFIWLAYVE